VDLVEWEVSIPAVRVVFCSDVPELFLSCQSHKLFELESSKIFRVDSESSHKNCRVTSSNWFASLCQCRVK